MAQPMIAIKLDNRELIRAGKELARFGSRSLPQVVTRAINKTLPGMRAHAVKEIMKEITPTAKKIRSEISIQKANQTTLTGELISKGIPLGLIHFRPRQTKKGVSVLVKKKKGRKLLRAAYVGTGTKGGEQVFRRELRGDYWGPRKSNRMDLPFKKFSPYDGKDYRLPVKRLTGPRVPDIMENEPVFRAIDKMAQDRLDKNFSHELKYSLNKLSGKW